MGLRSLAENALALTLEGDAAQSVILTGPDGNDQAISGQVIYETARFDPDTGNTLVYQELAVTVRIGSLSTVPQQGERWFIQAPVSPETGAALASFVCDTGERALVLQRSLGMVTFKATRGVTPS